VSNRKNKTKKTTNEKENITEIRVATQAAGASGTKDRAPAGWERVYGAGVCVACVKNETPCFVNAGALEAWRDDVEAGQGQKKPPNTGCWACKKRRKLCDLPGTRDLRKVGKAAAPSPSKRGAKAKVAEKKETVVPSATPSEAPTRRWVLDSVEIPSRKRARRQSSPEGLSRKKAGTSEGMSEGTATEIARALWAIERRLGELAEAARGVAQSTDKGKGKEKEVVEVTDDEEEIDEYKEDEEDEEEVAGGVL